MTIWNPLLLTTASNISTHTSSSVFFLISPLYFNFRETGEPFHRIIVWQDLRASDMVKSWNSSFTLRVFKLLGHHSQWHISHTPSNVYILRWLRPFPRMAKMVWFWFFHFAYGLPKNIVDSSDATDPWRKSLTQKFFEASWTKYAFQVNFSKFMATFFFIF